MNSLNAVTNGSKALIANSTLQIDATPSQVLANALYPYTFHMDTIYTFIPYIYFLYIHISQKSSSTPPTCI